MMSLKLHSGHRVDQPDTSADEGCSEDRQPETCTGADRPQRSHTARQLPRCEYGGSAALQSSVVWGRA